MRQALLLIVIAFTSLISGQNRLEKFESTYKESKTLIMTNNYTLNFNMVYDNKSKKEIDSRSNFLTLNQSTSKGELTALSPTTSKFDLNGSIKNYKVVYNDQSKLINISYSISGNNSNKNIELAIKPNGSAVLSVNDASNRPNYWIGSLLTKN